METEKAPQDEVSPSMLTLGQILKRTSCTILSAWSAEVVMFPVDLVKTRMMMQGEQCLLQSFNDTGCQMIIMQAKKSPRRLQRGG